MSSPLSRRIWMYSVVISNLISSLDRKPIMSFLAIHRCVECKKKWGDATYSQLNRASTVKLRALRYCVLVHEIDTGVALRLTNHVKFDAKRGC